MMALAALVGAAAVGVSAAEQGAPPNDPIVFCVNLSDEDQTSPVYSDGEGRGVLKLRRDDLTLSWDVSFTGLTGAAVAAQMHGPQRPGGNASALFPLSEKPAPTSPIKGSIVLDDARLKYLLNSRMYVNITTAKYPAGEIRGQVQRIRPGATCP